MVDGKTYSRGDFVELNLGKLSSFTWQQLEDKLNELQGKADRGEPLEENPMMTFADYADGWLARAKTRVKSYKTVHFHVERYLKPTFARKPLNAISTSDVNNWIAGQRERLNPATVKRTFNTLRAIFNDAIKANILSINPCTYADKITGIVSRQRFLEADEALALYTQAQAQSEWLADFLLWAMHSGMRKTEIRRIMWDDIRTMPDGRTYAIIKTSKSDKPRFVPCTATMIEVLQRQKQRKQEENNAVFPVSEMTLRRHWKTLRTDVDLDDVVFHDLRRTHTSHIVAANVDLNTLAQRLGHSDLSMMQKHYAVLIGSTEAKATQTIDDVFSAMLKTDAAKPQRPKRPAARKRANSRNSA